ncbi:MAG: UDP-glucose 4-epimerase GalE [Leeuwenhoekiella sp.]|nr:MAG: UDP-glucose 4-epimerase GalE [Leeuwenhoekiella sp.]
MNIMVVGGAGYIGSHFVKLMANYGFNVTVLDNLSTGHAESVLKAKLVIGNVGDFQLVDDLLKKENFDAVFHFAANSVVGESVTNPSKYYRNNVSETLTLLDLMVKHDIRKFVFSSTAAIFGEPCYTPIDESHRFKPINPYGMSKLMIETILKDYHSAYGLSSVSLRYFNAAGADPDGELGENHEPETHLIPNILKVASGEKSSISIFGQDYKTEDGTCVRDYVHVNDLSEAHYLALKFLSESKSGAYGFNLGNGVGFSVRQVIDVCREVVSSDGASIDVIEEPRRNGDPAVLVADARKAQESLGWKPEYNDIKAIVKHAWGWEKKRSGV